MQKKIAFYSEGQQFLFLLKLNQLSYRERNFKTNLNIISLLGAESYLQWQKLGETT